MKRRKSRQLSIGKVKIGGNAPISVQSMTNTDTRNIKATVAQIKDLEEAGCEIIRVAVVDTEAAENLEEIKKRVNIPLIADIHFDYRLALKAIEKGVDALRVNPGNIGGDAKFQKVKEKAKEKDIVVRIGVNAGSIEKELLDKYKGPTPEAMVESALKYINIAEKLGFYNIKISLKSSDVLNTIYAYRLIADKVDYPFHLGITEAGTLLTGTIKSAVGLGVLLAAGIGDTIRVSLTSHPVDEVRVGYGILKALKLRQRGVEIVSCPTCGRCEIDLLKLVEEIERRLVKIREPVKVAVMGCVVNGPGEAKEADIGIAGGKKVGLLFKHGEVVKKIKEVDMADVLVNEVEKMAGLKEVRSREVKK